MPPTPHVAVKRRDVLVLIGTVKGVFLLRSTGTRAYDYSKTPPEPIPD